MPFPGHDPFWKSVAGFLSENREGDELIVAPDEFAERFPTVHSYGATFLCPETDYPWVIVHKGMLERINKDFLTDPGAVGKPVFANEVFVIFSRKNGLPRLDKASPHLASYAGLLANMKKTAPPTNLRIKPRLLANLTVEEIREEMNLRYANPENDENGGYEQTHLWDKVRDDELGKIIRRMTSPVNGLGILEIGCGLEHRLTMFTGCDSYLGTDLSDVGIEKARKFHAGLPWCKFERMDAMNLQLDDNRFDLVLCIEMIEHVNDPVKTIEEAWRVLKPGGRFLVSSANQDSLNLRMMEKLGHAKFKFTCEHVREFGHDEMVRVLETAGFKVLETAGLFLAPYIGIPGVDPPVRHLTDDDPEVVEWFRRLGEFAPAEFGFEFVMLAIKN